MAISYINNNIKIAILIITTTIQCKSIYKEYMYYKHLSKNEQIIEIEKSIENLDKSSDTLHELIDNY